MYFFTYVFFLLFVYHVLFSNMQKQQFDMV